MVRVQSVGSICALLVTLSFAANAWAQPRTVEERHSDATFQVQKNFGGSSHVLVGVGARRAMGMITVYGAAMYVGVDQGKAAWESYLSGRFAKAGLVESGQPNFNRLRRSAEGRHFLVYGRMPRAIEMAFARDVRADQIANAYDESWERVGLDRAAAGQALTQFMAAVNHSVQKGQRMVIRTAGNNIWVTMPQGTTRIQGNAALVRAIWSIWFGDPALQRPLRDGMMSNLENLHNLRTGG
jgi:hypothetical protein